MPTYSAGSASVDIKPNFRNFVRSLRADLDRVKAELGVDIKPAMAGFSEELRRELDRVTARLDVEVSPDTAGFARQLEAELSRVQAEVAVDVEVDESSLTRLEQTLRARLAAMDLTATVQVEADTAAAATQITALREIAGRPVTVDVDADTSAAAAQIAALQAASVTVGVGASGGGGGGRGMSSGLITGAANLGALGLANLPAMATGLATIGADLATITQSAALLPGIFTAGAAAVGTLVVGFQGMKDAFSDSPKKVEEAMSKMAGSAKEVVGTIRSFGEAWGNVRKNVQGTLFEGVSQPLGQMITAQLPVVERGMVGVAGKFRDGFKIALGELGNEKSTGALSQIFRNTENSAGRLNTAILPIMNTIRTLATTGSNFLPQLSQGFANAATKFDAFITKANQSGDLARWIKEGIDAVKTFGSVIGNLGSSLASIFRAVKGDGDGFLVTVDKLTERMATFLKSDVGQAKLRNFFMEGREQMDRWEPILRNIGTVLHSVYEASQAWAGILMPFLQAASSLLAGNETAVQSLLVAWLAYRTLGPLLTGLIGQITAFRAASTAAAAGGAGALKSSMAGLGAVMGAGGAMGVGILAVTAGLGFLAVKHNEAKQAADDQRRALEALGETLDKQSGKVTEATVSQAAGMLEAGGFLERAETFGVDKQDFVRASLGVDPNAKGAINEQLTQVILSQRGSAGNTWGRAAEVTGLSDQTIAQALQGVPEAVTAYADALAQAQLEQKGGFLPTLSDLKNELNDTGESAATLGGEMNRVDSETAKLGESVRRTNEAINGAYELTEQGRQSFEALGLAVQSVPDAKTIFVDSTTEEQQRKLEELGYTVTHMEDGTVKVTLNDEGARTAIQELVKPEFKTVTVTVKEAKEALGPYAGLYNPAPEPKADGGPITGGVPGRDSVPLLGMPGEHMLDTEDVQRLGGQSGVYRFRAALKAGHVRGYKDGGAVGWSEKDEIDLQQAQTAITQAEEKAQKVRDNPKSSDADKRQAQLKVDEARLKAQGLESRKAGRTGPTTEVSPQAPMPARMSDDEIERLNAESRVDEANTERNRIYADPAATDEQKRAADRDYASAQNALEKRSKSGSGSGDGSLPAQYSAQGIFARAGAILGQGLLSMFGLENSVLSESNIYNKAINDVHAFYSEKGQEGATDASGDYAYQPKNLPVEKKDDATASSSSDSSTGGSASENSYDASGGVEQWRPTFIAVLDALGMPRSWIGLGLAQMQTESGGNPRAINNWDSNAAKGTPSKGLMQVIDPTFQSYRSPKYPNNIWDPGANIAASLGYLVARYGGPEGVWGQGHGYANGGRVVGPGGPRSDSIKALLSNGEFVVNAASAAMHAPLLEDINSGKLPTLPAGLTPRGGDVRNVTHDRSVTLQSVSTLDVDQLMREQDRWSAFQSQGDMAALP